MYMCKMPINIVAHQRIHVHSFFTYLHTLNLHCCICTYNLFCCVYPCKAQVTTYLIKLFSSSERKLCKVTFRLFVLFINWGLYVVCECFAAFQSNARDLTHISCNKDPKSLNRNAKSYLFTTLYPPV